MIIVNVGERTYDLKKKERFFSGLSVDAVFILFELCYSYPSLHLTTAKTGLKGHVHPSKTLLKD